MIILRRPSDGERNRYGLVRGGRKEGNYREKIKKTLSLSVAKSSPFAFVRDPLLSSARCVGTFAGIRLRDNGGFDSRRGPYCRAWLKVDAIVSRNAGERFSSVNRALTRRVFTFGSIDTCAVSPHFTPSVGRTLFISTFLELYSRENGLVTKSMSEYQTNKLMTPLKWTCLITVQTILDILCFSMWSYSIIRVWKKPATPVLSTK